MSNPEWEQDDLDRRQMIADMIIGTIRFCAQIATPILLFLILIKMG